MPTEDPLTYDMRCIAPGCEERSKGPRFSYCCVSHMRELHQLAKGKRPETRTKLIKARLNLWRAQRKAERAAAAVGKGA